MQVRAIRKWLNEEAFASYTSQFPFFRRHRLRRGVFVVAADFNNNCLEPSPCARERDEREKS